MKKLSLLLFLVTSITIVYSQENKNIVDLLMTKRWYMQGLTDKTSSEQYTRTEQHVYYNGQYLSSFIYYLSDSIDKTFDSNKVGSANNGKYIVTKVKNVTTSNFSVYEIISISSNALELRFIAHTHTIKYK